MQEVHRHAGRAVWAHILSTAALDNLSAPERWHPRTGTAVFVAERGNAVVGFVCCGAANETDAPNAGEIRACYVAPHAWGTGIGQALLAAAVEHLRASGFEEAIVWTEYRNHRPLRFYRVAGWRLDGVERRYLVHGAEVRELRHRRALR